MKWSKHYYLKTSDALTDEDKAYFAKMLTGTDENIEDSIRKLSQLLYKHHGKKAVIIIDEYDVPLDKAYQNGYYCEMVSLIRGLFGQALKTNDYLQFAFLTGCLRVSKESIFTGLNNFKVLSIMDSRFDEQFGFTDDEVKTSLRRMVWLHIFRKQRNGMMAITLEMRMCTVHGMS